MPKESTIHAADWEIIFVFNSAILRGIENILHKMALTDCYKLSAGVIIHQANIVISVLYGNEGVQHWRCYIFRGSQLVVCFSGHATPLIQTGYTSLQKIIYTLKNLIFGSESQACKQSWECQCFVVPKIHLTSWEPHWVASSENLALWTLSHGNVMGLLHETHKSLWCYLDLYYHRNSTGW